MKKALKTTAKVAGVTTGVLFAVYFWNVDQKVMAVAYKVMNSVFDRKKADIHL